MNTDINIDALVNPVDNSIFYVGATKENLEKRLRCHLYDNASVPNSGVWKKRMDFIAKMKSDGYEPKIILLEKVPFSESEKAEKRYYELYTKQGCDLMQDPNKFQYLKGRTPKSEKNGDVRFLFSTNESIYQSIVKYKNDNDFPSIRATVRFIISRFLKNNQ